MNILGVGGMELMVILILMLIVAGPKRMIQWAYVLGQYVAKMRKMWDETVSVLQKELDDAGMNVQLPKEPPTRANLNKTVTKMLEPVTRPVEEAMNEVDQTRQAVKNPLSAATGSNGRKTTPKAADSTATATKDQNNTFGTWSGTTPTDDKQEGSEP